MQLKLIIVTNLLTDSQYVIHPSLMFDNIYELMFISKYITQLFISKQTKKYI